MVDAKFLKPDTLALHGGQHPDPTTGARAVPIYQTTSFVFRDVDHAASLFNLEVGGHIYSRISNPTVAVFEERVAALEEGTGALGVSSAKPSVLLPGLTTIAAAGLPGYESSSLQGVFAPAGVPAPILQKLTQEIVRYLHTADAKEKYLAVGVEVVGSSPEQFEALIKSEIEKWCKIIHAKRIVVE